MYNNDTCWTVTYQITRILQAIKDQQAFEQAFVEGLRKFGCLWQEHFCCSCLLC